MLQYELRHVPNFEYQKTDDGFEVLIPQTKSSSWFYFPHCFAIFLVIFTFLIIDRDGFDRSGFSILIDFIFFSLMYTNIGLQLLWLYFGKEVVRVESEVITLQKQLKWRFKTKTFLLSEIGDLKFDLSDHVYFKFLYYRNEVFFGKRTIGFIHNLSIIRFGRGLSDKDAIELIALIKNHIASNPTR